MAVVSGRVAERVDAGLLDAAFGVTGTYLLVEPELEFVIIFLTNRWGIEVPDQKRAMNAALAAASTAGVAT